MNLYSSQEAAETQWFNRHRRVIFVNGMANSAEDHARSARALSLLRGCPVIGVFNNTDGVWSDLGQCITDKANMVGVQAPVGLSFEGWTRAFAALCDAMRRSNPSLSRVDCAARLIAGNPATSALFGLLAGNGGVERTQVPIYCHSQGNLITSNALTAVALGIGIASIRGVQVNSFGSPCRYWPPGLNRQNNAFTLDPVSWLDLRTDLDSSKIGFVAGHSFLLYMQNDSEFVVNRFRWGSFGMTANMDERGLARHIVRIGNNPPRVKSIFEHLRDSHWSDSDDVAYEFVQAAPAQLLRQLKTSDATIIDLLIELLEDGITFPSEEEAILRLRTI